MGTATVFQSNIKHKGIAPTKDPVRFNLNIVFKLFMDFLFRYLFPVKMRTYYNSKSHLMHIRHY
jgi:hypothetical protein